MDTQENLDSHQQWGQLSSMDIVEGALECRFLSA